MFSRPTPEMATEGQADYPRGQGQGLAGTHTPVTLVPLCRGAMSQVPTRGGPLPAPHSSLLPGGVLCHSWAQGAVTSFSAKSHLESERPNHSPVPEAATARGQLRVTETTLLLRPNSPGFPSMQLDGAATGSTVGADGLGDTGQDT